MITRFWMWLKGLFSVVDKLEPVVDTVQKEFNEIVDEVQLLSKKSTDVDYKISKDKK